MTTPREKWAAKQRQINDDNECTRLMREILLLSHPQPAPLKTSWGDGMMVIDIALDADRTVSVYMHADDIAHVQRSGVMKLPEHSPQAIRKYPAPTRETYHTGADYAAACERCHAKRAAFDALMAKGKR